MVTVLSWTVSAFSKRYRADVRLVAMSSVVSQFCTYHSRDTRQPTLPLAAPPVVPLSSWAPTAFDNDKPRCRYLWVATSKLRGGWAGSLGRRSFSHSLLWAFVGPRSSDQLHVAGVSRGGQLTPEDIDRSLATESLIPVNYPSILVYQLLHAVSVPLPKPE